MRSRTPQRSAAERVYGQLRERYLTRHPVCAAPWSQGEPATTVQHRMGRTGCRLLDMEWWAPSCLAHNVDAESDGQMAAEAQAAHWKVSPDFTGSPDELPIIPVADLAAADGGR